MTIRKRFDEASFLFSIHRYEPALILTLVAIAAASERYRRHETSNAPKKIGDDSRWFAKFIADRGAEVIAVAGNDDLVLSKIVYKKLRCEVIHEGVIDDTVFVEEENTLKFDGAKLTFGIGLIPKLLETIRTDPIGRNDFRDLLSDFENIVRLKDENERELIIRDFWDKYHLSGGQVGVLRTLVEEYLPERLLSMTFEDTIRLFRAKPSPTLMHGGTRTGLRFGKIIDEAGELTNFGYERVREIAAYHQTIDVARP